MTRTAFDVSDPTHAIGGFDICAFYLGGMTPHPWTDAQIAAQQQRYRLPIWVYDPTRDPLEQSKAAIARLIEIKAPLGITVAFDLETRIAPVAVNGFADHLHAAGGFTLPYGSSGSLFYNPVRSGYWVADPTGISHQYEHPHVRGTQWNWHGVADTGQRIDESVFDDTLPLWDTRPAIPPPPATWETEVLTHLADAQSSIVAAMRLTESHNH